MKKRRKQTRRATRLEFAAIEVVGGLLPTDVISKIAAGEAGDQSNEGYAIPKGLKLRDEIARFYQIGRAYWKEFEEIRASNDDASIGFVQNLLRECFGFKTLVKSSGHKIAQRQFPINFVAENGRIPVVISSSAPANSHKLGIDESHLQFGDGNRNKGRSAFLLLQEYLNADEDALWGVACDGSILRLLRDNASLTRPAWIEVDIEKIFSEGLFPDFSAFWLILHASRFGVHGTNPSDCMLERWKERSRQDGAAAKDKLRLGVEAALIELGCGFLHHPQNTDLRHKLESGLLRRQDYYEELLRLVYRLIFLFAAEDRDLLHASSVCKAKRKAYLGGYSLNRLRERCIKKASLDSNIDAWEGMKSLFNALAHGQSAIGLVALGGLFELEKLTHLMKCKIENKWLLKAIWRVSWFYYEGDSMTKVNWRDMETEELGSVYESLLELTPIINLDAREFTFAEGDITKGNARKVSGSYYTPDSLVKLLLDTTLDPILDAAVARNPDDPIAEILKLSIIDPACGSGHFLLGAARRAADRITRHRMSGAISKEAHQHALREVVSHCIYGVDRNPMAVELCKVALWIEALEPGKPLSFLDARIKCGDSLIGVFDFDMLKKGIPNQAFKALSGDNKAVAMAFLRLNKDEREGKIATGFFTSLSAPKEIIDGAKRIADMPEETLQEVNTKARAFARYEASEQWQRLKIACDMYVAGFFAPKIGEEPTARTLVEMQVPTTEAMWSAVKGTITSNSIRNASVKVAEKISALHWPLAFPAVMAKKGFDAVVGNPPWERIKLQEQEFFASRDPDIAKAINKSLRGKLIMDLLAAKPGSAEHNLFSEFEEAKRIAEASSLFVRNSGRFLLSGVGDVNTYALFAELFSKLARRSQRLPESLQMSLTDAYDEKGDPAGQAGLIVPTGIATDITTSVFFGDLVKSKRIRALIDFENREKLFPAVDSRMKFSILAIGYAEKAKFTFFLQNTTMYEEKDRRFTLAPEQIAAINPNTKTSPVFRSLADAELTAKLYSKAPIMIEDHPDDSREENNPWGISFQRMFDMSNDSHYFRGSDELEQFGFVKSGADWEDEEGKRYVPLYEAKMIHHYDHRWATYERSDKEQAIRDVTLEEKLNPNYEPIPRYWLPENEVDLRASRVPTRLKTAFKNEDSDACLKILSEWVLGFFGDNFLLDSQNLIESFDTIKWHLSRIFGEQKISQIDNGRNIQDWLSSAPLRGAEMHRYTSLTSEDIDFLEEIDGSGLELAGAMIERKKPRWLMGWRDITNSTNERTVIATVYPYNGVSNKLPIMNIPVAKGTDAAKIIAALSSVTFDYIARQKIGGTAMNFFIYKQLPLLSPSQFFESDDDFITERVLKLTYTSQSMRPWADDLGYRGVPFSFDPNRRAHLRAELDAFFAIKYELTRDELRYVLDPHDVKGKDYPSETFRGIKKNEKKQFGEYRTQRLVLEVFDRMTGN